MPLPIQKNPYGKQLRGFAAAAAKAFGAFLTQNPTVTAVLFEGEMGAGKTTFIKAVCRELGVSETVSSPTFSIVNEYRTGAGQRIYHFDFYRINDEQEALNLGFYDYLDSGNLCLIEWPAKIQNLLPENYVWLKLQVGPARNGRLL
jgi:tRNA threonylcarbamoyladenosine biosynthesis protein TsaE